MMEVVSEGPLPRARPHYLEAGGLEARLPGPPLASGRGRRESPRRYLTEEPRLFEPRFSSLQAISC
jgi:hypothetical protein